MKKIVLLLAACLFGVPVSSQQIRLDSQNVRQELTNLFRRADQAAVRQTVSQYLSATQQAAAPGRASVSRQKAALPLKKHAPAQTSAPANSGRQWQIAMFLAAADRPISETLGTLRYQMKKGLLRQAAVLDITPRTVSRPVQKDKRATAETFPATFYFLYMADGKPVTEKIAARSDVSANDLLEPLFRHFNNAQDVYSAAVVDGHSSGFDIFYGKEGWFNMEHLLSALQNAGLKLDVLNLDSCHMGSFYNLHKLVRYQNVSYLVASSDVMIGSSDRMYYTFLYHLNYPPRQAAVRTTQSIKNIYEFDSYFETNNSVALDLTALSAPVREWFNSYGMLMTAAPDELRADLLRPFDPRWGTWRSFNKILRKQIAYLQEHEPTVMWQDKEIPKLTQNVIQNGNKLLDVLQDATLTQWCYSAQYDRIFTNHIPPNIDCMDGVSVTKDQLEELLEEESETLKDNLRKETIGTWHPRAII